MGKHEAVIWILALTMTSLAISAPSLSSPLSISTSIKREATRLTPRGLDLALENMAEYPGCQIPDDQRGLAEDQFKLEST